MAINITLSQLATLNNTSILGQSNTNFNTIELALPDALSRSGGQPNQMQSALDMNGNNIINLPPPSTANSPARLIDVVSNPNITIPNTGTSGHTVPFLDGNNTWSGSNAFTSSFTLAGTSFIDIGGSGIGSVLIEPGASTTTGFIVIKNPSGSTNFAIGNDSVITGATTINSSGVQLNLINNAGLGPSDPPIFYFGPSVIGTASSATGFTNINIDHPTSGGAIWFRNNGSVIGDIYNTASNLNLNVSAGISGTLQVNNTTVALWNSAGVSIGNNGGIGGLLAFQGSTSGTGQITVTATGGTLQLNSTNCIIDTSGNLTAESVNVLTGFACASPTILSGTSGSIGVVSTIINASGTFTATLPNPASPNTGRLLFIKSQTAQLINSSLANVVGLSGGAAATTIVGSATAGKWVIMQSDGTNWQIMAGN